MAPKKKPRKQVRSRSHNPNAPSPLQIPRNKEEEARWIAAAEADGYDFVAPWARWLMNNRAAGQQSSLLGPDDVGGEYKVKPRK